MDFNPKVSIVIPVFNGADYLREALDSALAQTYKNIEIIVVNDGSIDNGETERIACSYGKQIRYFVKPNGGVASALNFGIRNMSGEFFSWLSHDDVYYPDKIRTQISYISQIKEPVVLYSDYDFIDHASKFIRTNRIKHIEHDEFRYSLITEWPIHGCTTLVPKRCFDQNGLFNENLKYTQDYDLWFRMANNYKFIHIPEILIKSRLHDKQGTLTTDTRLYYESKNMYTRFLDQLFIEKKDNISEKAILLSEELDKKGFLEPAIHALRLSGRKSNTDPLLTRIYRYRLFLTYNLSFLLRTIKIRLKAFMKAD